MMATLTLWGHALAALFFGLLAVGQLRNPQRGWPQKTFVLALAASALWALAVAGIDPHDVTARVGASIRNIAWLAFMGALVRRADRPARAGDGSVLAVYAMAILLAILAALVAVVQTQPLGSATIAALVETRRGLQMMGAVAALLLVRHLHGIAGPAARGWIRPTVLALATMWTFDAGLFASAYVGGAWLAPLIAIRGFGMAGVALVFALAAHRGGDWSLAVSRTVAMRSLSAIGLALYAVLTLLLISIADRLGGSYSRIFQAAAVFGTTAALLTLVSTPWLRAWTKVKVAKHFFRHRYDYRAEWQRFTETLGTPGNGAAPLAERIVKAVADLTDSPAGLLLVAAGGALEAGAAWNWDERPPADRDDRLARHLAATGRIVELDAVRGDEATLVPGWIRERADAWAIVPLMHGTDLVGAILLARPPVDRALDWEDLDLLRVAGRQAASYLAEDRAHAKLADAARFDEFNRRFAFILHDIKNLVSGLTLVAHNAEKHADNPAFRTDMVATLQDSAARMNALLARLSQHHQPVAEAVQPVDLAALAMRAAVGRRAQQAVEVRGSGVALAQPGRLEQVLGHLIQNAVEAGPDGATVVVDIAPLAGRIAVEIADRGCGMSPAFVRDQLFRPFASSKPDGFGIGAYEARQLVEAMGATIAVESREGEGTRFRLMLPAAPVLESAA